MNEIKIFNNDNFGQVRTLQIENKPYFVGKDVAEILGYSRPTKAIQDHCKGVLKWDIGVITGLKADGTPAYQNVKMSIISEGDLYRLIIKSKLPQAEQFESWVMDEILPQIRQTGGYIPVKEEDSDADILAKAVLIAQKTLEEKDKLLKEKDEQINILAPKADFYEDFLSTESFFTVGQIAKGFAIKNLGRNKLYKYLKDHKILITTDEPYQSHVNHGHVVQRKSKYKKKVFDNNGELTEKLFDYEYVVFTPKGVAYLYRKLQKDGYLINTTLENAIKNMK